MIGVITDRFSEEYEVDINAAFTARLNHVAFEGATKRNKPMLKVSWFCRSLLTSSPVVSCTVECCRHFLEWLPNSLAQSRMVLDRNG